MVRRPFRGHILASTPCQRSSGLCPLSTAPALLLQGGEVPSPGPGRDPQAHHKLQVLAVRALDPRTHVVGETSLPTVGKRHPSMGVLSLRSQLAPRLARSSVPSSDPLPVVVLTSLPARRRRQPPIHTSRHLRPVPHLGQPRQVLPLFLGYLILGSPWRHERGVSGPRAWGLSGRRDRGEGRLAHGGNTGCVNICVNFGRAWCSFRASFARTPLVKGPANVGDA